MKKVIICMPQHLGLRVTREDFLLLYLTILDFPSVFIHHQIQLKRLEKIRLCGAILHVANEIQTII